MHTTINAELQESSRPTENALVVTRITTPPIHKHYWILYSYRITVHFLHLHNL